MDIIDSAQELETAARRKAIATARNKLTQPGCDECIECGTDIPSARKAVYPSAVRCIDCQSAHEGNKHG